MSEPLLIAEVGTCHEHNVSSTKGLLSCLRMAGVNAVKFQFWSDGARLAQLRHAPELAGHYQHWATHFDFLRNMADYARGVGFEQVICSVFLEEDVGALAQVVDHFKIASLEALDVGLRNAVKLAACGRVIYMSTGCCTNQELLHLKQVKNSGLQESPALNLRLLHCITAYPTPYYETNLQVIRNYQLDGYSDHSCHPLAGALAISQGAKIVEFHVRHERTSWGCPDYHHSLAFENASCGIEQYVRNCLEAAVMVDSNPLVARRQITVNEDDYTKFKRKTE